MVELDLNRLKAERIAKGLTQEEVAKELGYRTRSMYTLREQGKVDIGINDFTRLIAMLGYNKNDLPLFFK